MKDYTKSVHITVLDSKECQNLGGDTIKLKCPQCGHSRFKIIEGVYRCADCGRYVKAVKQ